MATPSSHRPAPGRKVLLVGWDAADWQIIQPMLDRGELPALERLVNGGVMGNLASLRPMLSPMLWNSIATGKRPFKHGVHGFTEVDHELGQPVPVSSRTRRCQAVWDILHRAGYKTHVVGWFATHPAPALDGGCVSDRYGAPAPLDLDAPWPLAEGTVSPAAWSERLGGLRLRPEEIDADVLRMFVPGLAQVDQAHDKRLHELAIRLAEGFSIHAAATELIEHEPWDFAAVYYRTLDWICHDFMPYHPPCMPGVYPHEMALYQGVVSAAYRLHDAFLGRLVELAGPDTTVVLVSDHGFQSGADRPQAIPNLPAAIADWHRPVGILAMRGDGLRQDELIHGASLLDVTPTILSLFGLPPGADMDGRVLAEAFEHPPQLSPVESWEPSGEEVDPGKNRTAGTARRSAAEEWSIVRQFVELGYLDDPGADPQEAVESTTRENRWNLARSYLDAHRFADALPLLESVCFEWPERADYRYELALCQLNLELVEEATETAAGLAAGPSTQLLLANIAFQRGDRLRCLEGLTAAEGADAHSPGLQNQIGLTYLSLRRFAEAEACYRRSLDINPDDAYAHLGLSHCLLHAEHFEAAAESALRALGLRFNLPLGHYQLGVALARLGDGRRAIQALETCLHYQPGWMGAHRYLAALYAHAPDGADKVRAHRAHLNARPGQRRLWNERLAEMRQQSAERARDRVEARACRRALAGPVLVQDLSTASDVPVESKEFVLVSGLPRSGTSLMMQMLVAGGLEAMTDELRPPDQDNPRGYFEWQEIKSLPRNPRLIEKAHGRVTKVISMLLPWLPNAHRFRVIFMVRPVEEVLASQERMRNRLHGSLQMTDHSRMKQELQEHRDRMLKLLHTSPNVEVLEVDVSRLLDDPLGWGRRIAVFAGQTPEAAVAMASVVAPELFHRRCAMQSMIGLPGASSGHVEALDYASTAA